MKKTKLLSLLLAGLMTISTLTACTENVTDPNTDGSGTNSKTEVTTDAPQTPDTPDTPDEEKEPQVITVLSAKGTDGLEGDLKAAFAANSSNENTVSGAAQKAVPHSIVAALQSPTVLTSVAITVPTEKAELLANLTIDASVNGTDWVNVKSLGSDVIAGKTYNLNIYDETAYLYVRIRQGESQRTKEFVFRHIVLKGLPQEGAAGNLENVVIAETENSGSLITMSAYAASSKLNGNEADVFVDNENSWSSNASTVGNPNWLIAAMTKKTEIRKITVKLWDSNRQARGAKIQASADGAEWVDLYTIEDLMEDGLVSKSGTWTYYINDTTNYSFIRILQSNDLAAESLTLNTVLVYGIESEEDANRLSQRYYAEAISATAVDSTDFLAPAWAGSGALCRGTLPADGSVAVLECPAVLYYLELYTGSFGARANGSVIWGSVDGETWEEIGKIGGLQSGVDTHQYETHQFTLSSEKAYRYVKITLEGGWNCAARKLTVYGIKADDVAVS